MTFADAISNLRDGRAAKRPSWGGYVFKTVTSQSGAEVETYTLTFRKRSDVSSQPVDYVYTFNGTAWTAPATKVDFDAEIMAAMVADDWTTGAAADYEASRTGQGTW